MTDEGRELSRVTPAEAPARNEDAPVRPPLSAPPPRPPVARTSPPPIAAITGPSKLTRAARVVWGLSFLAGIVALVVAFLRRTDQFARLRTLIEDTMPGYDAETVDTAATVTFWATFAALAVFLLVELMLRGPAERRAMARWGLLLVLVVHTAVAAAAISFIALDAEGTSTRLLVLAQLVLAALALLLTTIAAAVSRRRQPEQAPAASRQTR